MWWQGLRYNGPLTPLESFLNRSSPGRAKSSFSIEENSDGDGEKAVAKPKGQEGTRATAAVGKPRLEVVHPHAAGIDVGNSAHYVAVRPDRDSQPVRRFECFAADLHRLAQWLHSCGVQTVALQSTGGYWIPRYDILEEQGFEVYLVNSQHTKNLPGRKSDVQESQWLRSPQAFLRLHGQRFCLTLPRFPS